MKIWIKYLVASILGIIIAILLPSNLLEDTSFFDLFTKIIINIGVYAIIPFFFFSIGEGVNTLRQEGRLIKQLSKTMLYGILATVIVTFSSVLVIAFMIIAKMKIPSIQQTAVISAGVDLLEGLAAVFPSNVFSVFSFESRFILPLYVFAFFLGLHFGFDKLTTKPATVLFNSLSRIFYHMNSFFVEIVSFGFIVLSFVFLYSSGFGKNDFSVKAIFELNQYRSIIITFAVSSIVLLFGLVPLILYYVSGKKNPYTILYGLAAPAIAAFFSRDSYFSGAVLTKHLHENFKISKDNTALQLPLLLMFVKPGTAFISASAFFLLIKSYTNFIIDPWMVLWIVVFAFLVSYLLANVPSMSTEVSIMILFGLYMNMYPGDQELKNAYAWILPILPILGSIAALINSIMTGIVAVLANKADDLEYQPKSFI